MSEARLLANASSLAAANWSDSTGFANDAQLAIVDSYATHTNLDRSADTTTGVDYLHIRDGVPIFGPDNGRLIVDFDATYTAKPNFVWRTKGGLLYLEAGTACGKAEFIGAGNCFLCGGTFNTGILARRNAVKVQAGCDFGAVLAVLQGRAYLEVDEDDTYSLPDLRMTSGNPRALIRRQVESAIMRAGLLMVDNRSGNAGTSIDIHGGVFRPIAGTFNTINWYGGDIDLSYAQAELTLGGTALNVFHDRKIPDSTDLVTMGTPTKYPAGFSGAAA